VDETIEVEVAYALPERQLILKVEVPLGASAIEAVRLSGIEEQFPEIELGKNRLGVFGKLCKPERMLQPGDRVEIYRPLIVDPRAARRALAAAGKSMGKAGRESATDD
jgi:putative ubiquitin-RnfH superfamily antitoxin RatB of RatAB toxin-antitoxin module